MAKVKFFKVTNAVANDTSKLPIVDGQFIFAYDTGKIYIDKGDGAGNRVQISGPDIVAGAGISISGTTITNAGVRSVVAGDNNDFC